ncbi:DUF4880 domain-containing protein [Seongchinamella sediminis]|uniref:DUF4880 domain-containing protein n=1 Tax=Seongchinamella sediminis TaxID=2283635 RepID=A0A3L7DZ28_9GAMM|nr:FecR domain-containing protein [Seongchinamella sediminis]RLQ21112.1 DUF4880 domain-containing protein [Seongchinamella sediminis]
MKNILAFPRGQLQLRREAAAWLVRLDGDDVSGQELSELREWLDQDPRHVEELVEMARLWDAMDCMAVIAEMLPAGAARPPDTSRGRLFGVGSVAAMASALAAVALLAVFLTGSLTAPELHHQSEPQELVYRTGVGEQSEITLRDGSVLVLNTSSEVRVSYRADERLVLLTGGEAYFTVAKNRDAPFVVHAGRARVRALGTAFSVRLVRQHIEVLVDEGRVQVGTARPQALASGDSSAQPATAHTPDAVTLGAGGRIAYDSVLGEPDYLPGESLQRALAWRSGKLQFAGEPLSTVVDEVSRYTDQRIEIVDSSIADLRIGGYFDIGEIDGFLAALEGGFGVSVVRLNDDIVQLSALDASADQ